MIQNNYLHSYLLFTQVMMSTTAAITHTAFVGRMEAVSSPSPNDIAVAQLFFRHLIFITLYILRLNRANVTVEFSIGFWYNDIGDMMRETRITKNDAGQRLDKYLSKRFKAMPKSLMYKYLRTKYIKLNGKKVQPDVFLSEGDVLTFYIRDEFFEEQKSYEFMKAGKQLDILYEDNNILLLDKKVGVICHQDSRYDADTLNLRVLRYLYEKGEYKPEEEHSFTPALCNRIDRNTGGVVIAAKNAEALRVMNQKIRDREIEKYYLCAVKGVPKPTHATLTAYHRKDERTNTVTIRDHMKEGFKQIVTEYTVLDSAPPLSLCEVLLHTGKTHQIRAHMAHIGHPLLGDEKYGDRRLNAEFRLKRQALYSYKLTFRFTTPAGCLESLNNKSFAVDEVWFAKDKKLRTKNLSSPKE